MKASDIHRFCERLDKIGIKVGLLGNYPWVYLDTSTIKTASSVQTKFLKKVSVSGKKD